MLTDVQVQNLKATGKQFIVWDIPNFGVRVSQSGTKTFIAQIGRKRQKVTIGHYPALSLKDARREFLLRTEEAPGDTLGIALDKYRDLHLANYKGTNKRDTTHLLYLYLKPLSDRSLSEVTPADVLAILDPMTSSMNNHMFGVFRTFFNWCERRSLIKASPMAKLRKAHKQQSRDRVLTDAELVKVWEASMHLDTFGRIVRLAILTGQRRGELAQIRPSWLGPWRMTIPKEVTKNGSTHTIPLPGEAARLALSLAEELERPWSNWSKPKARLNQLAGLSGYTIHDIRRTFATNCARLGIQPLVVEKILNHAAPASAGGSIAAIYNRHSYAEEMRDAISRHEAWLMKLLENTVVEA